MQPKVLVSCPTSSRHKHLLDKWIKQLNSLTYNNFDVLLVDTTLENSKYFERLSKIKLKDKKLFIKRHEWDIKKTHPLQMLAHVREEIRTFFIENNYDYLFFLDDDIFIPKDSIERLIIYNKDHAGFYTHVFYKPHRVPCVLKSGEIIMGKGLEYYSFAEISRYKQFVCDFQQGNLTHKERLLIPFLIKDKQYPNLFKVYAVNLGCLMIKRKVLEKCQFRTHPTFIWGEDLWYYSEANDKGFEFWCDSFVRVKHENTDWSIIGQSPKQMAFWLVKGPIDATEGGIVVRRDP
jgi:cellulose synthase/poly-beta-1,6-N-acetylglucosamine synthase-like glycosyltransferase